MENKNKLNLFRKILLISGASLLLISAIFMLSYYLKYGRISIDTSKTAAFLESVMPKRTAGIKEETSGSNMASVSYDGQDYVALLSVPGRSVLLPVRASWDKNLVRKVPCLFKGTPREGTLIIGGVDSEGQFDFVPLIDIGDVIIVTDVKGYEFTYTVSAVKHAQNARAQTLTDENYDLTLFAKDKKTGDYLLVRCKMK